MSAVEFERVSCPADAEHAASLREGLRAWLNVSGVPAEVAHGVLLAVSEAVDNVVVHAYPPERRGSAPATIELTLCLDQSEIVITVADQGSWAQPESTALEHDTPNARARHGRGIILMNNHVDEVAIHHDRDGTTVLLRCQVTKGGRRAGRLR